MACHCLDPEAVLAIMVAVLVLGALGLWALR